MYTSIILPKYNYFISIIIFFKFISYDSILINYTNLFYSLKNVSTNLMFLNGYYTEHYMRNIENTVQ